MILSALIFSEEAFSGGPGKAISRALFKTITEEYKLRLEPFINDTSTSSYPELVQGNTIAIYPKESLGYALSQQQDDTGRIWWFVIMKNNLKPISSVMYSGFYENDDYYSCGWMSSRFLKKIE